MAQAESLCWGEGEGRQVLFELNAEGCEDGGGACLGAGHPEGTRVGGLRGMHELEGLWCCMACTGISSR